jgi:hypothetical protein
MSVWAVLATGPSMSQAVADQVRGRCHVVAVSDAYKLAPWADALASTDSKWWRAHEDALLFKGRKFTAAPSFVKLDESIERLAVDCSTNSALLGLMAAAVKLGAKRVLLCGVDMHSPGKHFFGEHKAPLRSSKQRHLDLHKRQFMNYHPKGVEIINCTPGSALEAYPKRPLEDCLPEPALLEPGSLQPV